MKVRSFLGLIYVRLKPVVVMAFPPADVPIRRCLLTVESKKSIDLQFEYLAFFTSLFTKVDQELKNAIEKQRPSEVGPNNSPEELASWWAHHLAGVRSSLYRKVAEDMKKAFKVRFHSYNRPCH